MASPFPGRNLEPDPDSGSGLLCGLALAEG